MPIWLKICAGRFIQWFWPIKLTRRIEEYMTLRYGDFILFKPPFNYYTMGLWLIPLLLLMTGGMILPGAHYSPRKIAASNVYFGVLSFC